MSTFNVQWSSSQLDHLNEERYAHFYALVHRGEVLYIGSGFRGELQAIIPASISRLGIDHLTPTVFLGRLREVGSGQINEASVSAILDLLVFARKPRYNATGKYVYHGAMDLQLGNAGCDPIPGKLRVENKLVFVSRPS